MGLTGSAIKSVIRLGGTGASWITPTDRDVVLHSPWESAGAEDLKVHVDPELALTYIPFFAGVRAISEDIGSLPLGIYRDRSGGGREKADEHWAQPLLHDQANPYMDAMTFRETLQAHALTWGNGYAEKEFAEDLTVRALWPLRPDRMKVLIGTDGIPFYRYRLLNGEEKDLSWRQVFHHKGLGPNGLVGYSVVGLARRALGAAITGERFGAASLTKGNIPPAVLTHPRTLDDTQVERLRQSWDEIDHRGRVAILEEGLDIKTIGLPPKDVEFIQQQDVSRSLMATLLRMPPHMLSDVERSTSWGTGIEQMGIGYVKYTLRSWLTRWEATIKVRLLEGDTRHYAKHTVDALLRGDAQTRWAVYRIALETGAFCIDDVLELEDRNPLPNGEGQVRRVPLNYAPLEDFSQMSMADRLNLLRTLTIAGFQPDAAAEAVDVPPIEHTGLEPVTVGEQGAYVRNGNGVARTR